MIDEIIKKHISNVNSFIDENGHNRFMDCVKELNSHYIAKEKVLGLFKEGHRYTVWNDKGQLFIADDANYTLDKALDASIDLVEDNK